MKNKKTYCNGCNKMTISIRRSRANFVCKECGHDKSMGDIYQYENRRRDEMYSLPKKCLKCGSENIRTETGNETVRIFNKGKLVSETTLPTPRKIFCENCSEELIGSGTSKYSGGHISQDEINETMEIMSDKKIMKRFKD